MARLNQLTFILLLLLFSFDVYSQHLKINELMSSNREVIFDEDGDAPDWIEIINSGNQPVSLADYFLSDDEENLYKWQIPAGIIQPGQPLLFFASGKNRQQISTLWYSLVKIGDTCRYIIPESQLSNSWKTTNFNDANWNSGPTGIGYGDNDDNTPVEKNTLSVFLRHKFTLQNIEDITALWLHMDYDDGFVAFLNGAEIARAGLGEAGTPVAYNLTADPHEAKIYQGQNPEGFDVSEFKKYLKPGENILAIQVHNAGPNSSDLTAIPFLSAGYSQPQENLAELSEYISFTSLLSHTNFKLSSSGETVLLAHKTAGIVDSVSYGEIPGEYSFGRHSQNIDQWVYFLEPTPGKLNYTRPVAGMVEKEVQFSVEEMFLTGARYLELSGAADDEIIRYTLTGGKPNPVSLAYSEPILINKNTVVKATIFKEGFIPGKTASRTYLFGEQPNLPVISVTAHPDDLFDNETGIYVKGDEYEAEVPYFGANFWEDWEKPANIEMAETDGERVFSLNCGIKIFGGWSRANPQKSLAVFFRNEYRDAEIDGFQLFSSKPIDSFSSIVLRNSGNDYSFSKIRDGMMTSLVRNMDIDIAAYRPSVLYLNGKYWGIINIREKLNEDYLASNYDVDADSVDILENNGIVVEGSNEKHWQMIDFLNKNSLQTEANFNVITNQIDISNFIDYQLSEIYFDNRDWPGNNIKYWRPKGEEGKWRRIMFDTDFGFGIYNENAYLENTLSFALATNGEPWPNPPWSTFIFRKLLENEQFRKRFINRFADVLNTTFLPENVTRHIDSLASAIEPEIEHNFKKWSAPSYSFWQNNINRMKLFATLRPENVRDHIKQQFELPGYHKASFSVLPTIAGTFNVNSLEIKEPIWRGIYFETVPVELTAKSNPGYKFNSWNIDGKIYTENTIRVNIDKNMNIRLLFEDANDEPVQVVINEINYNSPDDQDAGDWVEIFNPGDNDVDLSGWLIKDDTDDHVFTLPPNTILAGYGYLVICRNMEDFLTVHPAVANVIGELNFGFSSAGDAVRLFNNSGDLIDIIEFGPDNPWPENANGNGATLELRQYTYDNSKPESWKASLTNAGSPGMENSITTDYFSHNQPEDEILSVYPNPFSTQTKIELNYSVSSAMEVAVFSVSGKLVYSCHTSSSSVLWDGRSTSGELLQPGVYICRVKSEKNIHAARIILLR